MLLVEMMRRLLESERVCPYCGHRQRVRGDKRRARVCEQCGKPLDEGTRGQPPASR